MPRSTDLTERVATRWGRVRRTDSDEYRRLARAIAERADRASVPPTDEELELAFALAFALATRDA